MHRWNGINTFLWAYKRKSIDRFGSFWLVIVFKKSQVSIETWRRHYINLQTVRFHRMLDDGHKSIVYASVCLRFVVRYINLNRLSFSTSSFFSDFNSPTIFQTKSQSIKFAMNIIGCIWFASYYRFNAVCSGLGEWKSQ